MVMYNIAGAQSGTPKPCEISGFFPLLILMGILFYKITVSDTKV